MFSGNGNLIITQLNEFKGYKTVCVVYKNEDDLMSVAVIKLDPPNFVRAYPFLTTDSVIEVHLQLSALKNESLCSEGFNEINH